MIGKYKYITLYYIQSIEFEVIFVKKSGWGSKKIRTKKMGNRKSNKRDIIIIGSCVWIYLIHIENPTPHTTEKHVARERNIKKRYHIITLNFF